MEVLIIFGLFLCIPYLFRFIIKKGVSRHRYAMLTSLILALTFFLLSILFVTDDPFSVGTIMAILSLIGGYPTQYFLYPITSKVVNRN